MPETLHPPSADALARVRPLFTGTYPVPVRLWAMLDGVVSPRLVVDDAEAPTWALLQELAEGTVYIGGGPGPERLSSAIHALRQWQDVVICAWPTAGFPWRRCRHPTIGAWPSTSPAVRQREISQP